MGSLSKDDGEGSENGKKPIGLISKHFHAFVARLRSEIVLFHVVGEREPKTTLVFFSWTLIQTFRIQLQTIVANIWRIERGGINAMKFKAGRTHFLTDGRAVAVFVA